MLTIYYSHHQLDHNQCTFSLVYLLGPLAFIQICFIVLLGGISGALVEVGVTSVRLVRRHGLVPELELTVVPVIEIRLRNKVELVLRVALQ